MFEMRLEIVWISMFSRMSFSTTCLQRRGLALLHDDRPAGHQGQHEKSESRREADFDDQWKIDEPEALHRICPLLRRSVRTAHQRRGGSSRHIPNSS
jgi:hypothetical protein